MSIHTKLHYYFCNKALATNCSLRLWLCSDYNHKFKVVQMKETNFEQKGKCMQKLRRFSSIRNGLVGLDQHGRTFIGC